MNIRSSECIYTMNYHICYILGDNMENVKELPYHDAIFKGLELNKDGHDVILIISFPGCAKPATDMAGLTDKEIKKGIKPYVLVYDRIHTIKIKLYREGKLHGTDEEDKAVLKLNTSPMRDETILWAYDYQDEKELYFNFIDGSLNVCYESYETEITKMTDECPSIG